MLNLQSTTTAVVGVRVLLRGHSMEKTPSFIEVFGRSYNVSLSSGASRWMDMPFTRDESLQADKGFKITCECVCMCVRLQHPYGI